MADSEQIRQQVKSPAPLSTWFGVVLLLFLFGAMAVAIIGPAPRGDTYEQKRAQDRQEKLKRLRDDDGAALNNYAWVDKTKGTVRVPIERAMELTVADLSKKKPAPAGPIATPAPPATQPGASASPAASPKSAVAAPAASSSPASSTTPPGSPLPVRGATASPSP
jgi:hypothetical protein